MTNELHSLIKRVEGSDPALADELKKQFHVMSKRLEYGLNFERHTPESVALVGRPITIGDKVRFIPPRGETEVESDVTWVVTKVTGEKDAKVAELFDPKTRQEATRPVEDLVYVADFRDPIYPGLVSTGKVARGGDKPYHVVINAENYHALEAMLFTHQGKVDCIFIDPPYNTRANDWKYNNDYVDPGDDYAHSMWLAFMERRLKLAHKLLDPKDSVLIVTIDEKEYLRLGLLLEQTFRGAKIQMISTVINPKGTGRPTHFSRTDEFIFVVFFGDAFVPSVTEGGGAKEVRWRYLRRTDDASARGTTKGGPRQFYPIYVNEKTGKIEKIGEALAHDVDRRTAPQMKGCVAVFPIREEDGEEMNWGLTGPSLKKKWDAGYVRVTRKKDSELQPYVFAYLTDPNVKKVESGELHSAGRRSDGSWIVMVPEGKTSRPTTQWRFTSHEAGAYGTSILKALLPGRDFPFPKSLYAVEDILRLFVGRKPTAIVLDFFSGSGTTTHAVMRLNKQDGGRRRSISVTNNEVNDQEAALLKKALRPGDEEWEAQGICERVTKPRIAAAITGEAPEGKAISGDYSFTDEFPMADGFEENVEFFTLTYENPALIELDLAMERIGPLLWMRAGCEGGRIEHKPDTFDVADRYAVLFNIDASRDFLAALDKAENIGVAYVVTDDETQYQAIAGQLPDGVESVRLYESYLRTFQINTERV